MNPKKSQRELQQIYSNDCLDSQWFYIGCELLSLFRSSPLILFWLSNFLIIPYLSFQSLQLLISLPDPYPLCSVYIHPHFIVSVCTFMFLICNCSHVHCSLILPHDVLILTVMLSHHSPSCSLILYSTPAPSFLNLLYLTSVSSSKQNNLITLLPYIYLHILCMSSAYLGSSELLSNYLFSGLCLTSIWLRPSRNYRTYLPIGWVGTTHKLKPSPICYPLLIICSLYLLQTPSQFQSHSGTHL